MCSPLWTILTALSICWMTVGSEHDNIVGNAAQLVHERLSILKRIALTKRGQHSCNATKIIKITEIPFGNSGNNIIEFTHGLWVAQELNATLLVPDWMIHILHPFDTTLLASRFCYTDILKETGTQMEIIEITSEDSFFLFKIFQKGGEFQRRFGDKGLLPEYSTTQLKSISEHFLVVYAALWSAPKSHLLQAGLWIIQHRLQNNLRYSAVHKRSLEGHCSPMMTSAIRLDEFSPTELPMNGTSWNPATFHHSHPLCDMPPTFVREILEMHHRNNSLFFLAFDGRGDLQPYATWRMPVLSSNLPETLAVHPNDIKFIDMLVAMHADLFVANPLSTYSWEIFVIRACLALETVPQLTTNDLFVMNADGFRKYNRLPSELWVSWTSITKASIEGTTP